MSKLLPLVMSIIFCQQLSAATEAFQIDEPEDLNTLVMLLRENNDLKNKLASCQEKLTYYINFLEMLSENSEVREIIKQSEEKVSNSCNPTIAKIGPLQPSTSRPAAFFIRDESGKDKKYSSQKKLPSTKTEFPATPNEKSNEKSTKSNSMSPIIMSNVLNFIEYDTPFNFEEPKYYDEMHSGFSWIALAALYCAPKVFEHLLEKITDVNKLFANDLTLLHLIAINLHHEYMFDKNLNPIKETLYTKRSSLSDRESLDLFKATINRGGNIMLEDIHGLTPLHYAALVENEAIVKSYCSTPISWDEKGIKIEKKYIDKAKSFNEKICVAQSNMEEQDTRNKFTRAASSKRSITQSKRGSTKDRL